MKNNKYILYVISFLQGLVFYGAFSVIFREARGLSLSEIFVLESIFLALMLLFEVPWGIIGDKIGYKKTLIISYGLFLASKVAFYLAHSFMGFLLEAALGALAISGISGCDSALLYTSIDKKDSEKVFGIYGAMGTAGFLISALISSILVKKSMDLLAFGTIIPYTAAFFLSFALKDSKREPKERKEKKDGIFNSLRLALKNKKIIAFVVAIAVISETTHSICVFLNQPLYIRSSIDLKWFGIIMAFMQVATFTGLRAHSIKKKIGNKKILVGAFIAIIIANLLLVKSTVALLTVTLIFIVEGAFALTQPISETIKNNSIDSENRATILSTYAMVANVIGVVINLMVSAAARVSLEAALIYCLIINILALIPFAVSDKR